jgi:hypothetical protein
VIFKAEFYPSGQSPFKDDKAEALTIRCRSVSSDKKQAARTFLEEIVLPAFADWILAIERLPLNSTIRRE